jgi:hypothetical protein
MLLPGKLIYYCVKDKMHFILLLNKATNLKPWIDVRYRHYGYYTKGQL